MRVKKFVHNIISMRKLLSRAENEEEEEDRRNNFVSRRSCLLRGPNRLANVNAHPFG